MIDIEKIIIGEILIAESLDRQIEIVSELNTTDFVSELYKKLFTVIVEIIVSGNKADMVTIYQKDKSVVTPKELSELTNNIYSDALVEQHIKILKEQKYKKDVLDTITDFQKQTKTAVGFDEVEELKTKLIATLSGFQLGDYSRFVDFKEMTDKMFENINKNHDIEGISWGLKDLDAYTSGIILPRLYVIGGLKKGGKSRFVINLIKNLSLQKVKNVFLSLEMPAYEITKLIYATHSGIEDVKLRSKNFLSSEERTILKNTIIPKDYFDVECCTGLKIEGVLSRIRRYAKLNYKVIFIDYLQRIKHDRNKQAQELEEISVQIADATRANNVAIVLLSQLNALAEREVPTTGHLKGSGGIGESADSILLFDNLFRRTKKPEDRNRIDIHLEQRYGDSGVVHLSSSLGTCDVRDLTDYKPPIDFED